MSRGSADTGIVWPTLEVLNAMPLWMVKQLWRDLPRCPSNEREEAILERISVIIEAHGLVNADGVLKEIE